MEGSESVENRRLQLVAKACVCVLFTAAEGAASLFKSLGRVCQEARSGSMFVALASCDPDPPLPSSTQGIRASSPADLVLCIIPDCSCLDSPWSASPSPPRVPASCVSSG